MPNFAALCAAVFQLSTKNLRGGGRISAPPSVRGLKGIGECFDLPKAHGLKLVIKFNVDIVLLISIHHQRDLGR